MISSLNSLNQLYAASFSDITRVNAVTPVKGNAAEALKRIAPELPGQIIEPASRDQQNQGRNQGRFNPFGDDKQPSLGDFVRPKPTLAPSDEMALFALNEADSINIAAQVQQPTISLEKASYLAATQAQQEQARDHLSQRKQSYVAQLYAQTGDITFSADSVVNQAA